jgi:excisionase family DNA binding protein
MKSLRNNVSSYDREQAGRLLQALEALRATTGGLEMSRLGLFLQEAAVKLTMPAPAFSLLLEILENMAEGNSVALVHVEQLLTTQEAADLLGVSRPYLVRLLDSGRIAFHRVGSHRRVAMKDLEAYKAALKAEQAQSLDFLAQQAQSLGMGYPEA